MLVVQEGKFSHANDIPTIPSMVFYFDSLYCNSCEVSHLNEKFSLFSLIEPIEGIQVVAIFSPKQAEIDYIKKLLEIEAFSWPIYIDINGSFRTINSHLPKDRRFHSFMVDKELKPIYVGDPIQSEEFDKLFKTALRKIIEESNNSIINI